MAIRIPYTQYDFKYPDRVSSEEYSEIRLYGDHFVDIKMEPYIQEYKNEHRFYDHSIIVVLPVYILAVVIFMVSSTSGYMYVSIILFFIGIFLSMMFSSGLETARSYKKYIKKKKKYYHVLHEVYNKTYNYEEFNNIYLGYKRNLELGRSGIFVYKLLLRLSRLFKV